MSELEPKANPCSVGCDVKMILRLSKFEYVVKCSRCETWYYRDIREMRNGKNS